MRACVGACVKSFFIPLLLLHDSVVVSLVLACLPFSLSSNVWPPLSLLPSEHFLFFVCILLQALLRFPCMSQRVRLFCVTRSTDMRIVPGRESSASCPTPTLDLRLSWPSNQGFFTGSRWRVSSLARCKTPILDPSLTRRIVTKSKLSAMKLCVRREGKWREMDSKV